MYGCVASATGIPNCLTLIAPTPGQTKSGCYYCAKGFRLVAGTPQNGVTPYTCQAGLISNCAFYNFIDFATPNDADLEKCRYCETGFGAAFDSLNSITCNAAADPLLLNCLHQSWDPLFLPAASYGCGICEEKYATGYRDRKDEYCVSGSARGCLDAASPSDEDSCIECAWMIGQLVYSLFQNLEDA